ncbi:baseplate hub assembly protein [Synechococcus phage S-CREM1]|nr:baseplate hub assembly protein [Synechococcus phage S-CREM1]
METNFALMHYHKWSYSDLENMIPWEKQFYVDKLLGHLKEEEEKYKKQQQQSQGRSSL